MLLTRAKQIAGMFSNLFNSRHLPENTKLLLYKVAIRSILTYAFPIWFTISPTVARGFEVFERIIIRKCINMNFSSFNKRHSNATIYSRSSVVPFCLYALSLQKRFVDKLDSHENNLLSDIFEYEKNVNWTTSGYLSPIGILHEAPTTAIHLPKFFTETTPGSHRG